MSLALIRPATPADHPFVIKTWLRANLSANRWIAQHIPKSIYYKEHHARIEAVLASSNAIALIAYPPEDPATILGFGVGQVGSLGLILHYIYVKDILRGFGIGRLIYQAFPTTEMTFITHQTPIVLMSRDFSSAKLEALKLVYNPYLF